MIHKATTLCLAIVISACWLVVPSRSEEAGTLVSKSVEKTLPETVSFNAHIRPLMSNTCFTCHGPDEEDNESEFRIDSFASATSKLPSDDDLVGIVPGDPMASEVYLRIIGESDGEQMPPEEFRHHLTDYDKALFHRWIQQGAKYEQHWSYAPILQTGLPSLSKHADKVANEIDAFVLAKLEANDIAPAPLAEKSTLLRRLSLDLTGLPPTVQELKSFVADTSDNAYEKQVERLLESPHYGERMASSWLDAVRFADTVGFHGDQNLRNAPYRTYVIDSFNKNKPFDVFTREQIAGDLLPDPTPEQLTATGALRLNMVTREGGAQPGEYLAKYKADRVRTLGTAWLGSTLACCECHNHKYDPFSIKDFYSFGAFFDDLRQWGVYSSYGYTPNPDLAGFNNNYPFPPEMRVESPASKAEIRYLQNERSAKLLAELGSQTIESDEFRLWAKSLTQTLQQYPNGWIPANVTDVTTAEKTNSKVLADGSVLLTGKGDSDETIRIVTEYQAPTTINAIRLEVLPDDKNDGFIGRADDGRFTLGLSASIESVKQAKAKKVANRPRYVRVQLKGAKKILSLAELQVFVKDDNGSLKNTALQGKASQSTNYKSAARAELAIDGVTDGDYYKSKSVTHTSLDGSDPWWEVDLGSQQKIEKIVVWSRTDGNYLQRLKGFELVLLDDNRKTLHVAHPATPKPTTTVSVPDQVSPESTSPLNFAWSEADRRDPPSYSNGRPPLTLGDKWQSGPERWQLPSDENKMLHTAVYHLDQPVSIKADERLVVLIQSGDVGRVRLSVTPVGHAIAGWDAASAQLSESLRKPSNELSQTDKAALVGGFHLSTTSFAKQSATATAYRDRILALHSGMEMTLVSQPLPKDQIPVSRILPRGNWLDTNGDLAPPSFPDFLPKPKHDTDERLSRLDLANWIVSRENPLTSRHFVNRLWKQFFGAGLSGILDDLGNQGEWPSHPLLLDWLASEFVDSGWDVKHVVRKIVMSRTYRQAAAVRDDLRDLDPYNRMLAQQSARRLPAELVRDNALAISGLLQADYIGGPSFQPYQPAGHYSNLQFPSRKYKNTSDGRQYRRGVYMHWQRTFLHPMLVNFDAPARDECSADRTQSNSPQQALTLLNDPQFVEAAVAMANRLLRENADGEFDDLLDQAFLIALSRSPSDVERDALSKLFQTQTEYFKNNSEDMNKTLAVDRKSAYRPADPIQHAALAQVCRVILNLHETITRY
ncbi:DUF1553 domain-containing protein [Planctomycetes bacterium K23_9]|uniref:Planctomycete cytochrome C n=1 Tax=Stieleria marina TaxID=1930275 RepID=A0A517NPS0_9BACT|nr:Planctomycete cytochrome C [Planctomycetes bacterium K23_9]